jgi:broad specificity phosphatase PhoE
MTTTFYLVRHGANDILAHSISGRLPGISVNAAGRDQALCVADFLKSKNIQRIVSSPLERTRETAAPLARSTGLEVEIWPEFLEVDFGDWTGCVIQELDRLEAWRKWNAHRSGNQAPNGESMMEVQSRVVAGLEKLRSAYPGQSIAVFSHGDPLRAAILYYLGMPLDFILRLRIEPGSISILELNDWMPQVQTLNLIPTR